MICSARSGVGLEQLGAFLCAALLATTAPADVNPSATAPLSLDAQATDVCLAHHRQAQVDRREGRLLAAGKALRSCLVPVCSPVLREACASLLADVERDTPSVVLAADSEQGDLVNVSVYDADERIATSLDGVPLNLDPGQHRIEFRAHGLKPVARTVVLGAGDRNRRIAVRLEPSAEMNIRHDAPVPRANPLANPLSSPRHERSRAWEIALVGSGAALGIAGVWVGLSARADYEDAKSSCAPLCSDERRSAISQKSLLADGLFVLSAAALGYGLFRLLSTDRSPRAVSLWLGPTALSAKGQF